MTIQSRVEAAVQANAWDVATRDANAWRGEAIQAFAQAEMAVSDTLLHLAGVPDRGSGVRLRPLTGQRFEDLASALAGPFGPEGAKAAAALERFRRHEELRPALCHGVARVAIDRNGRWLVVFKLLALGANTGRRTSHSFDQGNADRALAALNEDGRKLASALQSLRSRLAR